MKILEKGEYVLVEFTGREKGGKAFETTSEETAKKEGIYSEHKLYGPAIVVVGEKQLLEGMEEALLEMKEGEQRHLVLEPEKAFGERKQELIGIVPMREFQKKQIAPFPGMVLEINNSVGKVQSVSGGRVRVDFNNELAGKTVEYDLKIVKKVTEIGKKVECWARKMAPSKETKATLKGGAVEITLPELGKKEKEIVKKIMEEELKKRFKEIKEIKFEEAKTNTA